MHYAYACLLSVYYDKKILLIFKFIIIYKYTRTEDLGLRGYLLGEGEEGERGEGGG